MILSVKSSVLYENRYCNQDEFEISVFRGINEFGFTNLLQQVVLTLKLLSNQVYFQHIGNQEKLFSLALTLIFFIEIIITHLKSIPRSKKILES